MLEANMNASDSNEATVGAILYRAVAFAIPVIVISALTDFVSARQLPAELANSGMREYLRWRWITDGAFALAGAGGAFVVLRRQLPTIVAAATAGLLFAIVSIFVVSAFGALLFKFPVHPLRVVWWIAGAALFSYSFALALSANREASSRGVVAGHIVRSVPLLLVCVLISVLSSFVLWCLSVQQFHPLMILFVIPYASVGGVLFGLFVISIPAQTFEGIQTKSGIVRLIFPIAPGILAGVAACVLFGTYARWTTWGSTSAFISAAWQYGLLLDQKNILLCTALGLICGPIVWPFAVRARKRASTQIESQT
jgi:hypothetical protein